MEFNLKFITITTQPRVGYWVFNNDQFEKIEHIDKANNKIKCSMGGELTIEEASNKVAKLIGEVTLNKESGITTKTYSIIHGDYNTVIDYLYEDCNKPTDNICINKDILLTTGNLKMKGEFENILSKTVIDEVVNVININIIDKHELYNKEDRIGIVTNFDKRTRNFKIKLNTTGIEFNCKREDFTKVQTENSIYMIHVPCKYCGR